MKNFTMGLVHNSYYHLTDYKNKSYISKVFKISGLANSTDKEILSSKSCRLIIWSVTRISFSVVP